MSTTVIQVLIRRAIRMTRGGENPAEIVPILVALENRIDELVRLSEKLEDLARAFPTPDE